MIEVDDLLHWHLDLDEAAIASVRARLGRRVTEVEGGVTSTIVGGALVGVRVAWVEQRWRDVGDPDIDDYVLHLRAGARKRAWQLDTYNPWFGCQVHLVRWYGDEVVVIYSEKHHTVVCAVGLEGAPRLRVIASQWELVGDMVLYRSEARGLVERVRLPELIRPVPLSLVDAATDLSAGTCDPGPPLVAEPTALVGQIARQMPRLDRVTAELLIGALAYRFWDEHPPICATYMEAYERGHRWNTPCWLPFYWHHTRAAGEGRALLAALDELAARPSTAHGAADGPAELAARHITERAGELAQACRAGHLPQGTSCHFWAEWSQAQFAAAASLFPDGMWRAWQAMRPAVRELLALGSRR